MLIIFYSARRETIKVKEPFGASFPPRTLQFKNVSTLSCEIAGNAVGCQIIVHFMNTTYNNTTIISATNANKVFI